MACATYQNLPLECRLEVLGYLEFHTLYALRQVSHQSNSDVQALERARWYSAQVIDELALRHRRHIAESLSYCRPSYAWSMGYTQESFVDYFLAYWRKCVHTLQSEGLAGRQLLCEITTRRTQTMPFYK